MKIQRAITSLAVGASLCGLSPLALHSASAIELFLGQTPPGNTPELFLPGIVSTAHQDICLAPSPDGDEFLVTRTDVAWFPFLVLVSRPDGKSLQSEIPSFSGKYRDSYPCYQVGSDRLFFHSNRPDVAGGEPVDGSRIWHVDRTADGWSEPVCIGERAHRFKEQSCPTVTEHGTVYFHAWIEENGRPVDSDLFRCRLIDGEYGEPENLGPAINSDNPEFHAYVAPDESFLVFDSIDREDGFGANDLYVSFRDKDGSWLPARNLGPSVNTEFGDMKPRMTADGKYLFFASNRHDRGSALPEAVDFERSREMLNGPGNGSQDIYWVDGSVVFPVEQD